MYLKAHAAENTAGEDSLCMIYALCMAHVGLSPALFWSLFIFSVTYFQWLSCTVLPQWPVCAVKSDELGNEKQVCVKCGDRSFILPSSHLS